MDVKLSGKTARFGGAVLALVACCRLSAADDVSSMVFVSAGDAPTAQAGDLPPSAPSDLVIHIADEAPPLPAAVLQTAEARGHIAIVASDGAVATGAVVSDPQVVPAGHAASGWANVLGAGPRRPSAAAGIQGQQRGGRYQQSAARNQSGPVPNAEQLRDAPLAYATSSPAERAAIASVDAPATPAAPKIKSPADHAKVLLVQAYQLSLTADNEAAYSQIIQWCSSAQRSELDADSRAFGANLAAWALNRRGEARADEGQSDLALADFGAALEFAPDNHRALHNRAVTLAQNGQFAEAFDDLCRVIQLDPAFAKAYSNRATLYVQAGDYDRALADYDSAIRANPELLPAHVGRGRVCHLQGKLEAALESLDAAVKLDPTDAEIVCSRADLLADLGRYEDALLNYAEAIDLNPKFEHAYRNGAWLLATCPADEIRDVEGALAGAQAALECGYGERHSALDTMAAALANAGRFDEALLVIKQAIEVAPEEVRPAYAARQQLYEMGQPFRAHPVGATAVTAESTSEVAAEQAAVYVEE